MAIVIEPYIPERITVHLGPPDSNAENVTVSFPDYVKNVASSEIYPTWEPAAIRANVLAIISFALNRVYTEYYPSRGYDFQITSSTAYDQKFIRGRNFFDSISVIVDDIFDNYLRREGVLEPLAAKFCNGTTVTCEGLSQWGSQEMAQAGADSFSILQNYYGDDIEIVTNAPIRGIQRSYPGYPISLGYAGPEVSVIQASLNRISRNYPAIPKIPTVSGVFDEATQEAVRAFQRIFGLTPDGVVGKSTWYQLVRLYVAVTDLAELVSQGQNYYSVRFNYSGPLREGDQGGAVRVLQYMLAILAEFDNSLTPVQIDGDFGPTTAQAVRQFQANNGLTVDGVVGEVTWEAIYRAFAAADRDLRRDDVRFGNETAEASGAYKQPVRFGQYPGYELELGRSDDGRAVQV